MTEDLESSGCKGDEVNCDIIKERFSEEASVLSNEVASSGDKAVVTRTRRYDDDGSFTKLRATLDGNCWYMGVANFCVFYVNQTHSSRMKGRQSQINVISNCMCSATFNFVLKSLTPTLCFLFMFMHV